MQDTPPFVPPASGAGIMQPCPESGGHPVETSLGGERMEPATWLLPRTPAPVGTPSLRGPAAAALGRVGLGRPLLGAFAVCRVPPGPASGIGSLGVCGREGGGGQGRGSPFSSRGEGETVPGRRWPVPQRRERRHGTDKPMVSMSVPVPSSIRARPAGTLTRSLPHAGFYGLS